MKAVVLDKFGKSARLLIKDVPKPRFGTDTLLVKVQACSLNPIDYKIKLGRLHPFTMLKKNKIVASDFCGEITELGPRVQHYKKGDIVYGMINPIETGCCAEYIAVKPSQISHKPKTLDSKTAASIPLAALTAYQALVQVGQIRNFESPRVLINGSSGGVGHFAVQIAKHFGAEVTAVCSSINRDFVCSLGATTVIDYTRQNVFAGTETYDIIFDVQGNLSYKCARKYLNKKSYYINTTPDFSTVIENIPWIFSSLYANKKAKFILAKPRSKDLSAIATLFEKSVVTVNIEKEYSMEKVDEAFSRIQTGRVRGKLIIEVTS